MVVNNNIFNIVVKIWKGMDELEIDNNNIHWIWNENIVKEREEEYTCIMEVAYPILPLSEISEKTLKMIKTLVKI